MIWIRPKDTEVIENNEKIKLLTDAGVDISGKEEKINNIKVVTSADKKVEICKRVYQIHDPWTFDGSEEDVIIETIVDPFAAIEFLLNEIEELRG